MEKTLVTLSCDYQSPVALSLDEGELHLLEFLEKERWLFDEVNINVVDIKNVIEF